MSKAILIADSATIDLNPLQFHPTGSIMGRRKPAARSWRGAITVPHIRWFGIARQDTLTGIITKTKPSLFSLEKRLLPLKHALKNGGSGPATLSSFQPVPPPPGVFLVIRKVAFLRHTMPRPLGFGVLAWNFFLRIVGRL